MNRIADPILVLVLAIPCAALAAGNSDAPTDAELRNLAYAGILDEPVTLVEGRWEGEPFVEGGASRPRVELVRALSSSGDLDGDGKEEAVVLLAESSGGSGVNGYLAVVGRREGRPVHLGTALVGDRVQVRAARVADGKIVLDVVQGGPDDAACCPSQLATRTFALKGDSLEEVSRDVTGTLSLAALDGTAWVLTHFSQTEPAPAEPAITLEVRDGRFGGSSGCNRYFGEPKAGDSPGAMSMGPVGGTRMACPEAIMIFETRYLQGLQSATRYGFLNARLSISWARDGDAGTLLFDPIKKK